MLTVICTIEEPENPENLEKPVQPVSEAGKNTPYPPARLRPPAPSWGRGFSASGYSCWWEPSEPSETSGLYPVAGKPWYKVHRFEGSKVRSRDLVRCLQLAVRSKPETPNLKPIPISLLTFPFSLAKMNTYYKSADGKKYLCLIFKESRGWWKRVYRR